MPKITDTQLAEWQALCDEALNSQHHPQLDADLISRDRARALAAMPALIAEVRRLRVAISQMVSIMQPQLH